VHEMSLMGGVFEVIEQTLATHEFRRVLRVKLKVGELTNAEPDALSMAFEAYAKGTFCEGAELTVERVPVLGQCGSCEQEFPITGLFFICPHCQNRKVRVIQGEELLLESLEVE